MTRATIGVLVVMSALAFGAGCEQNAPRQGSAERERTTSTPTARGPGGETGTLPGDMDRGSSASAGSAPSSSDLSGTGGSGDAGMGHADAGTKMR